MCAVLSVAQIGGIVDADLDELVHTLDLIGIFAIVCQATDIVHLLQSNDKGQEEVEAVFGGAVKSISANCTIVGEKICRPLLDKVILQGELVSEVELLSWAAWTHLLGAVLASDRADRREEAMRSVRHEADPV